MKWLSLLLWVFVGVACQDNKPDPTYYIVPEEHVIETDYAGTLKRIVISANCDWAIGEIPR